MNEQNTASDTNDSSTSSILSRSAQILQAASPYLNESTRQTLEGVVHVTDFLDTMQTFQQKGFSSMFSGLFGSRNTSNDTVSMSNLSQPATPIDTESLLKSIRPYCTNKEGELIDRIMNIFSMKKFFSMYQTMQSMMSMMNMTNEASQQSSESATPNQGNLDQENDVNSYYDTYWNSYHCNDQANEDESFNQHNDANNTTSNTSTSSNNAQMLDMLSSMIPPEQKSTFDTMKLLLESGMIK